MNLVCAVATDPQHLQSSSLMSRTVSAPQKCLSLCLGHAPPGPFTEWVISRRSLHLVPSTQQFNNSLNGKAVHLPADWNKGRSIFQQPYLIRVLIVNRRHFAEHLFQLGKEEKVSLSDCGSQSFPRQWLTMKIERFALTMWFYKTNKMETKTNKKLNQEILGIWFYILTGSREQDVAVFCSRNFACWSGNIFFSW